MTKMKEEIHLTPEGQPLWNSKNDVSKSERRSVLMKETDSCCIVCGKHGEESDLWPMVQIVPNSNSKLVRLEGRTVICPECFRIRGRMSVSQYASSRSFQDRLNYLYRVQKLAKRRMISQGKKKLLLRDFTLMKRFKNFVTKKHFYKYYNILNAETQGTCIYCGAPLQTNAVTIDHIVPRHLGGKSILSNYVIACPPCNVKKDATPVDDFVRSWPENQRANYAKRVKNLVQNGFMPKDKGRLLLSFENEHTRLYRFRLFHRLYSITVIKTKV